MKLRRRVLYVRDDGEIVAKVAAFARELRALRPGALVSDAEAARQLLHAALGTPGLLRRLGILASKCGEVRTSAVPR